jgi:hypothetical protein
MAILLAQFELKDRELTQIAWNTVTIIIRSCPILRATNQYVTTEMVFQIHPNRFKVGWWDESDNFVSSEYSFQTSW